MLDGDPAHRLNFRPMFIIVIVSSLEHYTSLLVCSSSSSNSSILCILFLEKKFDRTQSVQYKLNTEAKNSTEAESLNFRTLQ